MRALLLALCLPLGGCYLTRMVWQGAGHHTVREDLIATYAADSISPAADAVTVHALQTDGEVSPVMAERCRGETWIRLVPEKRDDLLAVILAGPEGFAIETATLAIDMADGDLLGEGANGHLTATVRVAPEVLGGVIATPAGPPPPPIADRVIAFAAADCAADLGAADWSLFPEVAAGRSVTGIVWVAAGGARFTSPPGDPGAPLDAAMFDVALKLPDFASRRAALAGQRVELACKGKNGDTVHLSLDADKAWIYSQITAGKAAGANGACTLQSRWRAELQRTAPDDLALHPTPFPLQVTVHSQRERAESGPGFGETLLRILATPFAVVGDIATGFLVATIDSLLDDDDCK